jgi:hypothetical protein
LIENTASNGGKMRKRKTVWNGIEYPSLNAAAKALNVSYDTLQNRLRKGYICDADVPMPNIKDKQTIRKDSDETD